MHIGGSFPALVRFNLKGPEYVSEKTQLPVKDECQPVYLLLIKISLRVHRRQARPSRPAYNLAVLTFPVLA